ncbi:MAG: homoserine kinase [Gaiellales bacterium]
MTDSIRVRAPASTANLGPAFDCAGAALELWNEVEVSEGDGVVIDGEGAGELPTDGTHLGLRAFTLLAPVAGRRFAFTNEIPLARGLGSSAATIAAGLVAGSACAGVEPEPRRLLELALGLEGHPDNIAPALLGGVCLSWIDPSGTPLATRIAAELPLEPVVVVPDARVSTVEARRALPRLVSHADAAHTAGRSAMLGAALAGGCAGLMRRALDDRLHEPYRGPLSDVYMRLKDDLPEGAAGVTVSGSGPSVVVWAEAGRSAPVASLLEGALAGARVMPLAVAAGGASVVP